MAHDLGTPEGLAAAIAALDPDFHGLLERKEVTQRDAESAGSFEQRQREERQSFCGAWRHQR